MTENESIVGQTYNLTCHDGTEKVTFIGPSKMYKNMAVIERHNNAAVDQVAYHRLVQVDEKQIYYLAVPPREWAAQRRDNLTFFHENFNRVADYVDNSFEQGRGWSIVRCETTNVLKMP